MICKHCLMSIEPAKAMNGMWKASEGKNTGLFTCLDNLDLFVHEPDEAPTPSGVDPLFHQEYPSPSNGPDLHCVGCGELLRPYMGEEKLAGGPKRWCLAADQVGRGDAHGSNPSHYHQPINPPTKDNN